MASEQITTWARVAARLGVAIGTARSKFWNRQAEEQLGTAQALLWCKDPKQGARGAGFVGGHYHRNWAIDDYRTLILNTIAWVTRVEVPANGVPSQPITPIVI